MNVFRDLTGLKFGKVTVLGFSHMDKNNKSRFFCKCDCGKRFVVIGASLISGNTTSCGCLKKEKTIKRMVKHNFCGCKLYSCWANMIQRVTNPKNNFYSDYGGRGIIICDDWKDFIKFKDWALQNGYKDGLTIDRIDVNGNYCPENCRWATIFQQQRNKRNNHLISYNGETHCMTEWCEMFGITYSALKNRLKSGWDIESALTKPIFKCENKK